MLLAMRLTVHTRYGRIIDRITKNHSAHSRHKAIRILEWMACSFRTMKIYELQDGIVFETENTVLNDRTKLTRSVLELCKPIIEEGPGDTVEFVHFSAKECVSVLCGVSHHLIDQIRYILHPDSGPFLQETKSHYDVAFSCVTYLLTSLCFIYPSVPDDEIRRRIVKGYHGLHLYANEFWIEHVLQYAKMQKTTGSEILESFVSQLERLLQFRRESWSLEPSSLSTSSLPGITGRSIVLSKVPEIQRLTSDILAFRVVLAQEKHTQKDPEGEQ